MTIQEALSALKEGNARFAADSGQHPGLEKQRRESTGREGQAPFATVISCSDSRVPVTDLFDQGVGDIFVIRVAGNVVSTTQLGSIEYAVEHLGTPVVLVLGHSHCGAVTAVVQQAEAHGALKELLAHLEAPVKAALSQTGEGEQTVNVAIRENIDYQIDRIMKSDVVRKAVDAGKTKVLGAVFDIEGGEVEWFE